MKMLQTMDKIMEKRLAANPKLANMPMVSVMQNLRNKRLGINPKQDDFNAKRDAAAGMNAMKKGGKVKKMAKGGSTASKRADGCATKGKTKGRFV